MANFGVPQLMALPRGIDLGDTDKPINISPGEFNVADHGIGGPGEIAGVQENT